MSTATITGLSAGTWTIDPTHTEVGFVARHLMVDQGPRQSFADVTGTVVVGESARRLQRRGRHQDRAPSPPARPTATATCAAPTSSTSRTTPR